LVSELMAVNHEKTLLVTGVAMDFF